MTEPLFQQISTAQTMYRTPCQIKGMRKTVLAPTVFLRLPNCFPRGEFKVKFKGQLSKPNVKASGLTGAQGSECHVTALGPTGSGKRSGNHS